MGVPFAAAVVFDNFSCVHGISALLSGTRYSINLRSNIPIAQLVVPEGQMPRPLPQAELQQQPAANSPALPIAFVAGYTKRVVEAEGGHDEAAVAGKDSSGMEH